MDRAFVIQFDPIAPGRRRFRGRVEQVASGEVAHFRTLKELIGFMTRPPRDLRLGKPSIEGDQSCTSRLSLE
jgi:hypothetical protein